MDIRDIVKINSSIVTYDCVGEDRELARPPIKLPKGTRVEGVEDATYLIDGKIGSNKDLEVYDSEIEVKDGELVRDLLVYARWYDPKAMSEYVLKESLGKDEVVYTKEGWEITDIYLCGRDFNVYMDVVRV